MPWSVSTETVTIGRFPFGFSAAPASGSSAGSSTSSVRVPVIFMADLGAVGGGNWRQAPRCRGRTQQKSARGACLTLLGAIAAMHKRENLKSRAAEQRPQAILAWQLKRLVVDEHDRVVPGQRLDG